MGNVQSVDQDSRRDNYILKIKSMQSENKDSDLHDTQKPAPTMIYLKGLLQQNDFYYIALAAYFAVTRHNYLGMFSTLHSKRKLG